MSNSSKVNLVSGKDVLNPANKALRVERLLLTGLDHYFSGQYEHAINIWTRVAFLDRKNDRARAYIERAKRAVAERQRESEELLHRGIAAFHRGDSNEARELINKAVEEVGPHELAIVFLERLNHFEQPQAVLHSMNSSSSEENSQQENYVVKCRPVLMSILGALAALAIVILSGILAGRLAATWFIREPALLQVGTEILYAPLPTAHRYQLVITHVRELHASGKVGEALVLLDTLDLQDRSRLEIDELRSELQRQLLDTGHGVVSSQ
tara:strand:+ start:1691 stop:2494 length:804 start_codon:yes stop_codon:yes gene_type:complete